MDNNVFFKSNIANLQSLKDNYSSEFSKIWTETMECFDSLTFEEQVRQFFKSRLYELFDEFDFNYFSHDDEEDLQLLLDFCIKEVDKDYQTSYEFFGYRFFYHEKNGKQYVNDVCLDESSDDITILKILMKYKLSIFIPQD